MKRCKQCGSIKQLSDFRKYPNSPNERRYAVCLACEKINNRYKYLTRKAANGAISEEEEHQLKLIDEIYAAERLQGLRPPGGEVTKLDLEAELERHKTRIKENEAATKQLEGLLPAEISFWLKEDLHAYTVEYLQDEVVDTLLTKYRPVIGTDEQLKPIYDDRYRTALDEVFARFDQYEDEVYNK